MSRIFIISAPSGAGKTSLVKKVCKTLDFVRPSVSFTTRKIRDSEQDKKDYFFIDKRCVLRIGKVDYGLKKFF